MKNNVAILAATVGLILFGLVAFWVTRDYLDAPKITTKRPFTPLSRNRGNEPEPLISSADAVLEEAFAPAAGQSEPVLPQDLERHDQQAGDAQADESQQERPLQAEVTPPDPEIEDEVITRGMDEDGVPTITRTYIATPKDHDEPLPPLFPGKVRVVKSKYRVTDTRPDSMQILKNGLNQQ